MAQQAQGNGTAPMIRPHNVDNLPHFTPEQKNHYKNGLATLWQQLETNPQGSQPYLDAENKIRAASMKIMHQLGRGPGAVRPMSGGGPAQRPTSNQGGGQGGALQNVQPANEQQGGQPQQQEYSDFVRKEMRQLTTVNVPPQVSSNGEVAAKTYRSQMMRKGVGILQKKEAVMRKGQQLQNQQRSYEAQGQQAPQQLMDQLTGCKNQVNQFNREWDAFKRECVGDGQSQGMARQSSSQGNQQTSVPQQGQPMQRTNSSQNVNSGQQMNGQPARSPPQPQGGFQQPQHSQIAPSPAQHNMPQQPPSAHTQQTPQSATQPQQQLPQQHNMQQQPNQQQQRPMNPQMAQQNMNQQQHPQQAPQNAVPPNQQQPQQRPQPHTHQSALQQASFHRQQSQNMQQQQQDQTQTPQVANSVPFNGPPSATQQTPNSAYPLQTNTTGSSQNTKFPIPKQLQMDPRIQQPAQGPPSRPTYSNAGMMSQPGVQRQAQYTLEGEGDHVLSKSKLDELTRQVTGSSNALSPEVAESALTLADDFVDRVITSACRLAKLRPNQTLDIKDIQLVLERNYGMRIPGYSLDEVRTVRKFQPAQGWQSKMQAIQAGKVMRDKE